MPIEIFFSYAHEDEDLMNQVRRQLVIYERLGRIVKWHDRQIPAGMEWESKIDERLRRCHVILLFVSPAFLESRYCWDVEVGIALERHERGEARVIPIILRPCPWEAAPFAKLQALPKDAKPLSQFTDLDQATLDVAQSIAQVAHDLLTSRPSSTAPTAAPEKRGVYRRALEGDRIPRIFAPYSPPTGINIPAGYQRRLNYIAAEATRDAAVRCADGSFQYPVQVRGPVDAIRALVEHASRLGELRDAGTAEEGGVEEAWFEYRGDTPPIKLQEFATERGLSIVHCGAMLIT